MIKHVVRWAWVGGWMLCALTTFSPLAAQSNVSFLEQAVQLARQSQRETSVPASVTLAQAMWETGRGVSPIGAAKNYFGIKAAVAADGTVNVGPLAEGWVWAWTKEWNGTRYVDTRERFRKYRTMEDSFRDHGLLLATTPRYAKAMRAVDDPREFARHIAAAGYATSPTYAADLIRVMDGENLYQYDLPRNDAQRTEQSAARTVNPGEIFQIYFDVKNTGFGTWSPTAGYLFANTNAQPLGATETQTLDQLVAPERVKRWAITMFAPQAPGTYRTAWQMKHGAVSFGPEMSVEIHVRETSGSELAGILGAIATVGIFGGAIGFFAWRNKRLKTKHTR
ncbi:MAG: glucosaminidase domain-containing protein [Chloroflexi bacterium]|nr:glucosaminidase domain-containing protein [Chloroflexota bacterium]